jgi:hypothetical protein
MKKITSLLLVMFLIVACDINTDPIELTATSDVNESISVSIPQTNGASVAFDQTVDQNLDNIFSNFADVTDVNINSLSYQYSNVTGNANAEIQSATISVNGVVIANLSNVNMAQEASNGTVFQITDNAILDQIESLFLTNSTATISFAGMAVSEEGAVSFDVALTINLTVTLS